MENEETLNIDIDDLFKDDFDTDNSDSTQETENENKDTEKDTTTTKAVSNRINEVKRNTEVQTQERIAKELGYESYEALKKARENDALRNAGLDTEDTALMDTINKLVDQRFADDPRFKILEAYEKKQKDNFVDSQLKEISKLSGNTYTSIEQLPKDTLELWEKTGNLKQAFLATKGEELLTNKSKKTDSFSHLASGGSAAMKDSTVRPLTEEEKNIWRMVNPDITEDELAKKTISSN